MPIFRYGGGVAYFAHIPKCGGSSVEDYIVERFGGIWLHDNTFSAREPARRWSRTSAQHIDWASLQQMLPVADFDAVFAVVRHPAARLASDFHFQIDVEKSTPAGTPFSAWLREQAAAFASDRFILDNHFRPQADFIPEDCKIFHLEHGLDAIVPYLDALAGNQDGPRFIGHANRRGSNTRVARVEAVMPDAADLALIREIHAADFDRFGYVPGRKKPDAPEPALDGAFLDASRHARARASRPASRLARRVRRKLGF